MERFDFAFSGVGLLLQLAALLLVAGSVARNALRMRVILAAAAGAALIGFIIMGEPVGGAWAAMLMLVNLLQIYILRARDRRIGFSDEEKAMYDRSLNTLSVAQAHHLLEQGLWISGSPGEVLTREGEPVSHLFYLSSGGARVLSGGKEIASFSAPGFVGEATVINRSGATGTVVLAEESRFWCVTADALRRFLREEPELKVVLENAFAGALGEKLKLTNQRLAGE